MEHISNPINAFMDQMSMDIYGISRSEAWSKGICLECKELALPKCYSEAGVKEYKMSGLCEACFDSTTCNGVKK
jgi:hypothetical protein